MLGDTRAEIKRLEAEIEAIKQSYDAQLKRTEDEMYRQNAYFHGLYRSCEYEMSIWRKSFFDLHDTSEEHY